MNISEIIVRKQYAKSISEREKLKKELEVYKKALELACEEPDNHLSVKKAQKKEMHLDEYFIYKAQKELKVDKDE